MIDQWGKKSPQCQIPPGTAVLGRRGHWRGWGASCAETSPTEVPKAECYSDPKGKEKVACADSGKCLFVSQKSGGGNGSAEKAESLKGGTEKLPERLKAMKQLHRGEAAAIAPGRLFCISAAHAPSTGEHPQERLSCQY